MSKRPKEIQPYKKYFEVQSKLGILVSTTKIYWDIITRIKHPTVKSKEEDVKKVLCDPDEIRVSKKDRAVVLFYKMIEKLYLCVVVKFSKKRGYIITAYWTRKIKEGELKWRR